MLTSEVTADGAHPPSTPSSSPTPPPPPSRSPLAARPAPALALVLGLPVALAVLVAAMTATGASAPSVVGDPGGFVRWSLPVVRVVGDIAVSVVLGAMALLALALPTATPAWSRAARLAAVAAVVWVATACAQLVLGFADVAGSPLGAPGFGTQFGYFLSSVAPGQVLLASAIGALVAASVAAVGVRTPSGAAVGALLTGLALVPPALSSHAAAAGGHHTAVTGWWLHGLGVGVWFGGLVTLALVGPALGPQLSVVARRYSALALGAFALVVVSGVANGWVQLGRSAANLDSGYGALLGLKSLAALLLGVAGWAHRRWLLARLDVGGSPAPSRPAAFWRLVAGEIVVMSVAVGLAVALVRTGPPAAASAATSTAAIPLAQQVTDEPVPPLPATAVRLLTEPRPDLLWLVLSAALLVFYLAGVARMVRRGDRWPIGRTISWVAGCVVLGWVTSFGAAAYMDLLFSAHMLVHMVVMSAVPPFFVLGAPITLALRTLRRRTDGTRGPREWLMIVVHSRWVGVVGHPAVAAALFSVSLIAFYYTPLFPLALRTHVGHELMLIHFLAVGYLFDSAVVGVDPGAARVPHAFRLVLLLGTMAFHAFFGVVLMNGDALLAADWYTSLGLGVDALADQQLGGSIAWGIGELPTLLLAVVLAVQWSRSDDRESRRRDRAADRDGDAELAAYNAMLAARSGGSPTAQSVGPERGGRQEP